MTIEHPLDRWVAADIARERARPRWRTVLGNFGFGFIFIGALLDLAYFVLVAVLDVDTHWAPVSLILSCIGGWFWARRRSAMGFDGLLDAWTAEDGIGVPDSGFDGIDD